MSYSSNFSKYNWTGDFNGDGKPEILCLFSDNKNWKIGSHNDNQLQWKLVSNTTGFGNTSTLPHFVGRFSRNDRDEIMFYHGGDGNWWLGTYDGNQLQWKLVSNTTGFGNITNLPKWIGDFNGDGKSDVLFYFSGNHNWHLGRWNGSQLTWSTQHPGNYIGNTSGFGNLEDGRPIWKGKFSQTDRFQILFYYPGDKNWWLGTYDGNWLQWKLVGNTTGFGQIWDGRPFWIGDFNGDGRTDVLFYYPGNKNWHFGRFDTVGNLTWNLAGNTTGFGNTSTLPHFVGRFSRNDRDEIMFYHGGDGNWWLGTYDGNQLQWKLVSNTTGFGNITNLPKWIGDFNGDGKSDVLFYYSGDGNWWLGSHDGNELKWSRTEPTNCKEGMLWTNYPATQSLRPYSTCKPKSLTGIVSIVREAEAANKHVHPFGSKWSFSDCAFTTDYVIDTTDLNREIQTVKLALTPAGKSLQIYHVEAGITIRDLYNNLDQLDLAFETMGGAAGQTIAGAISTGTHGGEKFMPPLADSVLAIHLIGAGGQQFWIEPSTGITDPALLKAHVVPDIDPKNIIYDDAAFNACLVSLGCMGVIYAVVLRVRSPYDLVETTVETTWQAFKKNASTYLNDRNNRFLQVLVNPYPNSKNENQCLVITRSEAAITQPRERSENKVFLANNLVVNLRPIIMSLMESQYNAIFLKLLHAGVFNFIGLSEEQKAAKVIQGILTHAPELRPILVRQYGNILRISWPPGGFRGSSYSVMDIGYRKPTPHSEPTPPQSQPGYSIEMFFPTNPESGRLDFIDFVDRAIENIHSAQHTYFAGYFALRFTGPTRAYIGMQQWNQTCSIEIAIVQGIQGLRELLSGILNMGLKGGGFAHWGQNIDWAHETHGSIYPRYAQWRQIYAKMSNNFTSRTFENGLSSRWSLTTPTPDTEWSAPWVRSLYLDLLGRSPENENVVRFQVESLRNGRLPRDVVNQFLTSQEYCYARGYWMYKYFLDRQPEPGARESRGNQFMQGYSYQLMISDFCNSPEFKARHPLPKEFLKFLYYKILSRKNNPEVNDAGGFQYHLSVINKGTPTINVINGFLKSLEYAYVMANEYFVKFLRRTHQSSPTSTHVQKITNGTPLQEVIKDILCSQEYINLAKSRH